MAFNFATLKYEIYEEGPGALLYKLPPTGISLAEGNYLDLDGTLYKVEKVTIKFQSTSGPLGEGHEHPIGCVEVSVFPPVP